MKFGISFVHLYQEKLCAAPGPGVASVNLALHLVCSFTSSVSEWSVCEVCLSKHSSHVYTAPTKGCRLHIILTQLHKTQMKNEQVWLVLDCLMRVSYICHETKVCALHLIYQTEKNLGNNE